MDTKKVASIRVCLAVLILAITAAWRGPAQERPAVQTRYTVGEEAHWTIRQGGERLGWHAARYLGRVEAGEGAGSHHFKGWFDLPSAAEPDAPRMRSEGDLFVDDSGHPLRFVQRVEIASSRTQLEVTFADGVATARIEQGGSTREVESKVSPGVRLFANNFISHFELALRLERAALTLDMRLYAAATLQQMPYKLTDTTDDTDRERGVQRFADSLGQVLVFAGDRLDEIQVASGKIVIARVATPFEPFTLKGPAPLAIGGDFELEEVRLLHEDVQLAGVLTRPKGTDRALPAVYFLSGTGGQDRHGFSGGLDLGTHEILDRITSAGFAVLRLDDRGTGASSAPSTEPSLTELVRDAGLALTYLRSHPWVDAKRIVLVGHSEGGVVAPLAARDFGGIAGLVLLATPGRPMHAVMLAQNRDLLMQSGLAGDALEKRMAELRAGFERLIAEGALAQTELAPEFRPMLPARRWLREHAAVELPTLLASLPLPVWIAQGELDAQVSPEHDARALDRALTAGAHPDHQLALFAGLDHLFKRAPGERSSVNDYSLDRRVDGGFLDALTAWLGARFKAP